MDIKKLNQFQLKDLKSLDIKQIIGAAKSRPDIFINICLIAVTIYGTMQYYNSVQLKSEQLTTEATLAEEKLIVVENFKKTDKKVAEFKEKFPKPISSDQFISKLSEAALKNNVQTISFAQPQKNSQDVLDVIVINFSVASESYDNLLSFLSDIEKFPYAVRLHKFTAFMGGASTRTTRFREPEPVENKNNSIEVNIEIGLINLKK